MSNSANAPLFPTTTRAKRQRRVVKFTSNGERRRERTRTNFDMIFGADLEVPMLSIEDFNIERVPGKPLQ